MSNPLHQRAEQLLNSGRGKEAIEFLENHLANQSDDMVALYLLAYAYLQDGDKSKARSLSGRLMELAPGEFSVLALATDIELIDEYFEAAEDRAQNMIEHFPREADSYVKMARAKLGQRSYDRALEYVNLGLEINPEDLNALNLKIMVSGILGDKTNNDTIDDALQLNPENAATVANHGWQLLREGKVDEALERLKFALSIDPTNEVARYVMSEAIKSKFWPYRMLFKYGEFTSKLSGKNSWAFLIGAYLVYRMLWKLADKNEVLRPFVLPVVYGIMVVFLLTWILGPLMNLYLLSNKYGRLLLDKSDKITAKLTGLTLATALFFVVLHFAFDRPNVSVGFINYAIMFGLMSIPFGTFLNVKHKQNRKLLIYLSVGLLIFAILLSLFNLWAGTILVIGGVFIYQWVINGIMIKENARKFE